MEILETKINVKAFGKDYELTPPTAMKAVRFKKQIQELVDKNDEENILQKSLDFIVDCGLDKDAAEKLNVYQLKQLLDSITEKKS